MAAEHASKYRTRRHERGWCLQLATDPRSRHCLATRVSEISPRPAPAGLFLLLASRRSTLSRGLFSILRSFDKGFTKGNYDEKCIQYVSRCRIAPFHDAKCGNRGNARGLPESRK